MEESPALSYWCHMCSQTVNPIMEIEAINCPICQSGFIEEMSSSTPINETPPDFGLGGTESDSDRALSLWAPILLGMIGNPHHRRHRLRRMEFDTEEDEDERDLDRELESMLRRRRRNSATILRLLQDIRAGMGPESARESDREGESDRNGERVILINPFNQTVIVQGSYDSQNRAPLSSLGDYFIGPGLDALLQHLAENDPNRYGTPPARKEAVEGLPSVNIEETLQCSVCLDECEIGCEVKQMPCGHKFHGECILPWLELHSSCPVCRYQLPSDDESKIGDTNNGNGENGNVSRNGSGDDRSENGRRVSVPIPWPFRNLFSASQSSNESSSVTSRSESSNDLGQGSPHASDQN